MLFFAADGVKAQTQVFDVNIDVNHSQISGSSGIMEYVNELAPLIRTYLTDNRWSENTYEEHERIRLNIVINLNSADGTHVSASILVATERPIYNTMQVTSLFMVSDNNWSFDFRRNRNLIQDEYQFDDIASILDYYAYMALAFDADSFSELGGEEYFRRARSVVETAQAAGGVGWSSAGSSRRTRHHLVNHFLNPGYQDLRKAIYQYHRLGLDMFTLAPEKARENALEALQMIRNTQRQTTDNYPFDLLFSTKYREFVAFFLEAEQEKRLQAYNLLLDMDRSRVSEYDRLR